MVDPSGQSGVSLPRVFGRYLLLRRLSQGGMGEIFLAKAGEIQGFEKLVIIKKILPHLAEDRDFIKRFIDEAQIAIKLNHGNIATVYEVGMVEGEYFLALEYVEGRDLRRTLSHCHELGERIPPDLCLYVAREVANALAYAHRRVDEQGRPINLVHCDISPPNILISFEGEVKIIDFGIAKSAIRIAGTNPNIGFGKFGYMAPEQLVSGGEIDRRTDTYALGVVLYEMLVGQRLFMFNEATDYRDVARAVTAGDVDYPSERAPGLGPTFDDLVMRALRPDPDERFQSAEEMRDAVQRLLYAMNPSVSADALARFLQRVFAADVTAERRRVEHERGIDLSQFQTAFENQRTHTVSFAVANVTGTGAPAGPRTSPLPREQAAAMALEAAALSGGMPAPALTPPPELQSGGRAARASSPGLASVPGHPSGAGRALISSAGVPVAITPTTTSRTRAPRAGTPTAAYLAALVGVAVLGGALAFAFLRPARPAPRPVAAAGPLDAAVPADAAVAAAPADAMAPLPPLVVEHRKPRGPKQPRDPRAVKTPPPAAKPGASPERVEAKFRAVRREYADFKKAYGARLEPEWNAVLFLATYGKADKYERLDGLIDKLRAEMARARKGD
jgi:serine/threonine-protein kinase